MSNRSLHVHASIGADVFVATNESFASADVERFEEAIESLLSARIEGASFEQTLVFVKVVPGGQTFTVNEIAFIGGYLIEGLDEEEQDSLAEDIAKQCENISDRALELCW